MMLNNKGNFGDFDTIAAISTPYGTGGVGIIRISGPDAFGIASRIFRGRKSINEIKSHTVTHGKIADPADGRMIDDVLLTKMDGPRTFTGEDVIEINCHGGIVVLKRVLSLALKYGARAAGPGEFTRRAFMNGRMDLAQAEAVIDLINSKTDESSRAAAAQLEGKLSERIKAARKELIRLIARIEAVVEYPEHDIGDVTGDIVYERVLRIKDELVKISNGFERGRLLREGITAAIIGKPNAGKSSLLNALAGNSRAIVTDIPGTTRDIIEEYVNINGIPVRFMDTAGIRRTLDPVESIGVERARSAASSADLVIIVLDGQTGILPEDLDIIKEASGKKRIVLINKTDVADDEKVLAMKKRLIEWGDPPVVVTSMKDGTGMDELRETIEKLFVSGEISMNNEVLITNARHRQLIDEAIASLESAEAAHTGGLPLDFVTIDIKEGAEYLGQITGESVSEDVVNEIFSQFCIGK
jgi:tRNA modification GTPase